MDLRQIKKEVKKMAKCKGGKRKGGKRKGC